MVNIAFGTRGLRGFPGLFRCRPAVDTIGSVTGWSGCTAGPSTGVLKAMKFSSLILKLGGVIVSKTVVLMLMRAAESGASCPVCSHSESGPEKNKKH